MKPEIFNFIAAHLRTATMPIESYEAILKSLRELITLPGNDPKQTVADDFKKIIKK